MQGSASPLNAPDQDALNALLMRRSRATRWLCFRRATGLRWRRQGRGLRRVNVQSEAGSAKILHLIDSPKPWESSGWLRLAGTGYVRLMRRLLFATDVPLRLDPELAPLWLRPSLGGALRALGSTNQAVVRASCLLPDSLKTQLRQVRRWFAYGRSHRRKVVPVTTALDLISSPAVVTHSMHLDRD